MGLNKAACTGLLLGMALAPAPALAAAAPLAPVVLPDAPTFPESLSSTAEGTLLIGSSERSAIYRALPGATRAEPWIKADATNGLQAVFGVLADQPGRTLWVCSNDLAKTGKGPAIKAFDLKSGAFKKSYALPPGATLCNDMTVALDGTLYATDMSGRILRLPRGGTALEVWLTDPQLTLADGIAMLPDGRLLVNVIRPGKLFTVTPGTGAAPGPLVPVMTPRPMAGPDGMRTGSDGRAYVVEGDGHVSELVLTGNNATLRPVASGVDGPTAVTIVGRTAWVLLGKMNYRMDPALRGKDPGVFQVVPFPTDR